MIDFIKIYTNQKECLEELIKSQEDTVCGINYFNGNIQYPCRKYFENIEVRITSKSGIIRNSLHKYYNMIENGSENNYTDFYIDEIKTAINNLATEVREDILEYKVTNLEFGLNVKTHISAESILKNNCIMFNFDSFNQVETFRNRGYYKQYNRTEYLVKFYDKAKQFNLPYHLLRVEIKIIDSKLLKKLGIYTLKDITNPMVLYGLGKFLVERFKEANIIDSLTTEFIPTKNKHFLELGKSPSFWSELKQNKSSSYYYEQRKKFETLLEKYNLSTIKNEIETLLLDKLQELLFSDLHCESG